MVYWLKLSDATFFNPLEFLNHPTQYIYGPCGGCICICIECDPICGLQRCNFPFKSVVIVKLYLRTTNYKDKKSCGSYELKSEDSRFSYKNIFKQ